MPSMPKMPKERKPTKKSKARASCGIKACLILCHQTKSVTFRTHGKNSTAMTISPGDPKSRSSIPCQELM